MANKRGEGHVPDRQGDGGRRVNDRRHGASHKGETINKWDPGRMKGALGEWDAQRGRPEHERSGIRTLSRAWMVPYDTLRRRIVSAASNRNS